MTRRPAGRTAGDERLRDPRPAPSASAPLAGITVVEVSGEVATRYCGKLFAAHGARVISAFEPDDRHIGCGGGASTAYGLWLDDGKERLKQVPDTLFADLVIAGQSAAEIARAEAFVARHEPCPLLLALTWFGTEGPYSGWHGSDGVIQAMTGVAYAFGRADGPPTLPQGHAPQVVAGATAFVAALASLLGRRRGQRAGRIDVSVLEAYLCLSETSGPGYDRGGPPSRRRGVNRFSPTYPQTIYAAADGWIGVTAVTPQQWMSLCEMIGLPDLGSDPAYATTDQRMAAADQIDALLAPAFRKRKAEELLLEGQKRRVPLGPVPLLEDLLRTPHWRERGSFRTFDREGHAFEGPAMPFRLQPHEDTVQPAPADRDGAPAGPLAGIRVLDLSMGWAGPLAGRHLADLGAEVIKVESCSHPDWWRGWNGPEAGDPPPHEIRPNFNAMNRNKRGITLDLRSERGRALARELASHSDLLIENYAPGVLDRLGLSARSLAALNPNLAYVSMGAFGSTGPWSHFRAYGSTTEQASGLPFVNGEADWAPCLQHIAYGDPIAGIYAAAASLIALFVRPAVGGGKIDLSQVECLFQLAADAIVAQSMLGRPPARRGSGSATGFWRGCLRARGEDAWVALDITDPAHVASLPGMTEIVPTIGPATDEMIAKLSTWTASRTPAEAARGLQEAGFAAGPVLPAHTLLEDPHLIANGYWRRIERRYVGSHIVPKPPYAIDGEAPPLRLPSPTLGQHNAEVLGGVLGLPAPQIHALETEGITGDRPA